MAASLCIPHSPLIYSRLDWDSSLADRPVLLQMFKMMLESKRSCLLVDVDLEGECIILFETDQRVSDLIVITDDRDARGQIEC